MTEILSYALLSFVSLFVIVDPVGLIPVFLSLTERQETAERLRSAKLASLTAFLILLSFVLAGTWVFRLFSISLPAFEVAGGLVLLIVALDMLQAKPVAVKVSREEEAEGSTKEEVAITPLAIPLLAGPGSITTVLLIRQKAPDLTSGIFLVIDLALLFALTYGILRTVTFRSSTLSIIALRIVTRLMGLLLAAIAVQYILEGIGDTTGLW